MKVIEYQAGEYVFEFIPSSAKVILKGDLTTIKGEARVDAEVDLRKPAKQNEYLDYARELYPEEFKDELGLKRALNDLAGIAKDEARIAAAKAEEGEENGDEEATVEEVPDEVLDLVRSETVLEDYVEAMAEAHEVAGDRKYMKLIALGALSAQLAPLPTGTVLGANVILTADSGRGKNFLCDAIASGLPVDWVYAFESASAKAFYYKAAANPECFKHTWAYPNEAEATDMLVETLRPLLSGGKATHDTVDSDGDGQNEARSLTVEGPITVVIPTVRNKLDGQLQTRMLVVDVADYEKRVQEHTAAFSRTLWASHAVANHASTLDNWRQALSTLTGIRRVVLPMEDAEFKLNANIAHGARLWRNFCSLMLTNAWLQQHNREIIDLVNGERAIVVSAEDYQVAYDVFKNAATRSLDNLGERHVKILNALYELQTEDSKRLRDKGFSLRAIAAKAGKGLNHEMIRTQKSFLLSLGFVIEDDRGSLKLVEGVEPSTWGGGKSLNGFPDPAEIKEHWGSPKTPDNLTKAPDTEQKPIDITDSLSDDSLTNSLTKAVLSGELSDTKTKGATQEKPIDKPNPNGSSKVSGLSGDFEAPKNIYRKGETELGSYKTNSRD